VIERTELEDDPNDLNTDPERGGRSLAKDDPVMRTDVRYFISYMRVANPDFRNFFYSHSHRKVVSVWNIQTKRLIREFEFEEQPRGLVVMPSRTHMAVALESGILQFINLKTFEVDHSMSAQHRIAVTTHINSWGGYSGGPMNPPSAKDVGGYS
jgi:hypothetical protein